MKYLVELIDVSIFENKEYEYKLKLENDKDKIEKWAKSLVGFANSSGGYVFVGVNNDGIAVGLSRKEVDVTKNLVLQTINRYIFPHIEVKFETFLCDNEKYILSIKTDCFGQIVVFKSGDYNEKVYIRDDGATIPASVNQILTLGKRKLGSDNQYLNEQYQKKNYLALQNLSLTYRSDKKELTEEYLISKEVLSDDGRVTQGLKMFSDSYSGEDTLTVCRLWNGNDKGEDETLDKKEFKGSLSIIFQNVFEFIRRNSKSGFKKLSDGSRLDTFSYPDQAIREAIVNALTHRDYSINGTQIDIDIYKNRLEITSPGSWMLLKKPNEYEITKIPSIRRNKIICNCFEMVGLMEKSGSGFSKIYKVYRDAEGEEPVLEDNGDFFTITIYDLLSDKENTTIINGKYDNDILDFCNGIAHSREEIQEHIGYKSRSHFMENVLNPLIESKQIIQTAPPKSKNIKYIANKNGNSN